MQTEQQYLQNYDPSQFEHPSVTVDILIFTVSDKKLRLLLIRRNEHPYLRKWALPGGFLRMDESADEAAARRVREEAGVENVHLEQLYTFSAVDRDPRTRVLSISYLAAVPSGKLHYLAGIGADEAALFEVSGITGQSVGENPEQSDSREEDTLLLKGPCGEILTGKDLAFGFVEDPSSFTLTELRLIHEAILGRPLDIGNFRRTIKREYEAAGRISERGLEKGCVGRPAMLYSFNNSSE